MTLKYYFNLLNIIESLNAVGQPQAGAPKDMIGAKPLPEMLYPDKQRIGGTDILVILIIS